MKTSGSLWKYYRDESFINDNEVITYVPDDPSNPSFEYKQTKMTCQTGNDWTKNIQIIAPLKYLSIVGRTLEMPLINCEINNFLTWSEEWIIVTEDCSDEKQKFAITNTKL